MPRTPSRARAQRRGRRERSDLPAKPPRRQMRLSAMQIGAVGVVAALALIGILWIGTITSPPPATTLPAIITQNGHVRGQAGAPVTIEEWADFQCPACGLFARTTEPQLLAVYLAKGQVSIVFHHFAFLGPESSWAAEASECASLQGKFFEYHDKLYASQAGENRGTFSKENLKRFGDELGLGQSFASCVDSGRFAQTVRDDTKVGEGRGVNATPTLFVNGRKIEGAATFEQLRTIIDPLLVGR